VCHGLGGNQVFAYTKRQQIMCDENCLDAAPPDGPVKLVRCHGLGGNQAWVYNFKDKTIQHVSSSRCLTKPAITDMTLPTLADCDHSRSQQWLMSGQFKWQNT